MSWFGGGNKETPAAASREDRQRCWDARDAYFQCLDVAGVITAGEEGKACAAQDAAYGKNCAKSWVRLGHPDHGVMARADPSLRVD